MSHFVTLLVTVFLIAFAHDVRAQQYHPVTGDRLAQEQIFRYAIANEPSAFDPQLAEDVTAHEIVNDLFEGLMTQDPQGNLLPGVALGFEASNGNRVFTFHLRDTAEWSDGTPVTAHDFVYAWRRLVSPETQSPYAWLFEIMQIENAPQIISGNAAVETLGVTAIDDHSLRVTLSAPTPYFPQLTTHSATFPVPKWTIRQHGNDWTRPDNIVSNGAYALSLHEPGKHSIRRRSMNYWNNGATIINEVQTFVIPDDAAVPYFLDGQLDRVNVPFGQYKSLKASYPNETVSVPRLCTYYYTFNISEDGIAAFKDERVRKALSLTINRKTITEEVLGSGQTPAYSFSPPSIAGFNAPVSVTVHMTQKERDDVAKRLMTKAGFDPSNPLSFALLFNTSNAHAAIAEAITGMWQDTLGVTVSLKQMPWRDFLTARGTQQFDLARSGWCGDYNEASTMLDLLHSDSRFNDGRYANPSVDALLNNSRVNKNPHASYRAVEQILADEVPIIPIYHYAQPMMLSQSLRNWPLNNTEQRWYSKNLYKVSP